jgi:DNA-binding MarR family transcriptional regulator
MKLQQPTDRDDEYIIFAMLFLLSNRLQTIGDSFFSEISTKQWFVLVVLGVMNGYHPTLNELSEAIGSSHQNVKQLVLKLEQKGFVELSKDGDDARRLRIKPTAKCDEFSNAHHEKSQLFMKNLFGSFQKNDLQVTKNVLTGLKEILERVEKEYVRE